MVEKIDSVTAADALFATRTNIDDDDDDNNNNETYQPLPLSDFAKYQQLVSLLYKTSFAVMLGNSLEWLDFSIYSYSEGEISSQLFGGNKSAGWATFGLGFAFRPIGAYVLGRLSDEKSRKLSFILVILSMASSTALLAFIPAICNMPDVTLDSYCFSNLWASAIPAIFLRCVQGFSAGAAAGGVNVIQTELWSTTERKGAIAQSVGVQNVSGASASMIAAAVVFGLRAVLGEVRYAAWGWRIAFLLVVPPSLIASCLIHRSIPESNVKGMQSGDSNDKDRDEFDDEEATISIEDQHESSSMSGRMHLRRRRKLSSSSSSSSRIKYASCHGNDGDNENESESDNLSLNATPLWLLLSVLTFSQFAIAAFNNLNVYLLDFVQTTYFVTANTSTLMIIVGKAVQVMITPLAAMVADIKGCYWTCAFGGTLCSVLALPMMLALNSGGGVIVAWILVSGALNSTLRQT